MCMCALCMCVSIYISSVLSVCVCLFVFQDFENCGTDWDEIWHERLGWMWDG